MFDHLLDQLTPTNLSVSAACAIVAASLFVYTSRSSNGSRKRSSITTTTTEETKSIMQPARSELEPPKDDGYTLEQLREYDGSVPGKPIWVAIKGTIFDVSRKADVYGPGKSYNLFAGKDGSKALGMSSLIPEHAVSDYSTLEEKDRKVLDDWYKFFSERYSVVGRVTDLPPMEKPEAAGTAASL